MRSYFLNASHFPGAHTAENITEKVRSCLLSFEIAESTIVTCVHGEAANAARKILQKMGWDNQA